MPKAKKQTQEPTSGDIILAHATKLAKQANVDYANKKISNLEMLQAVFQATGGAERLALEALSSPQGYWNLMKMLQKAELSQQVQKHEVDVKLNISSSPLDTPDVSPEASDDSV